MSVHSHTVTVGKTKYATSSATVPDPPPYPDLTLYAKTTYVDAADKVNADGIAALALRVAALEKLPAPSPSPDTLTLQQRIDASAVGATLDLRPWSYAAGATVNKALTIIGGTVHVASVSTPGIIVTAGNVTLDGMTITGPGDSVYDSWDYSSGIITKKATPVVNLVVRNCHVSGFQHDGMFLNYCTNLTVDNNHVSDCVYGGIVVLSGKTGTVTSNLVERIGVHDGAPDGAYKDAYGIDFEQGAPGTDPPTSDFTCSGNTVTDVPRWHGIDTHAGIRIVISGNHVTRCRSGIYITSDGLGNHNHAIDVNGNTLAYGTFSPIPDAHYGITFVYSDDGFDRNNTITGWPTGHAIYPPENCVNLTSVGNAIT